MTIYKTEMPFSNHLNSDELLNYHRHRLSLEENRLIENHLKECDFCSDALKGISEMHDAMGIYNITHELKVKMKKRMSSRKKIFSQFDLVGILLAFFIIGLVIFVTYYFLLKK
jgi:hypothetical protein